MRLVWIANEKQFNLLRPLYLRVKRTRFVEITVVCVDRVANGFGNDIAASEVRDYLAEHGIDSISFSSQEDVLSYLWSIRPNYIFTSTPYDLYLPEKLNSKALAAISTLCNVDYGTGITKSGSKWNLENPFWQAADIAFVRDKRGSSSSWAIPIGPLKLERNNPSDWDSMFDASQSSSDNLRIGWRPRWTLDSESTFIQYFETLLRLAKELDATVYFFTHPLFEKNLLVSEGDNSSYSKLFSRDRTSGPGSPNNIVLVPEDNYLGTLEGCDVLIADAGTLIAEGSFLGIPTIYTGDLSDLNDLGKDIVFSGWQAQSLLEVEELLRTDWRSVKGGPLVRKKRTYLLSPSKRLLAILTCHYYLSKVFGRVGKNLFDLIFRFGHQPLERQKRTRP